MPKTHKTIKNRLKIKMRVKMIKTRDQKTQQMEDGI